MSDIPVLPPRESALEEKQVHVWCAFLPGAVCGADEIATVLSADERARAERYRARQARVEYVATRALLRVLLGRYLNADPRAIEFQYGLYGKPSLSRRWAGTPLHFSVAHSNGVALLALARSGEVGVDVEHIRPVIEYESLASRVLAEAERVRFAALPPERQREEFFAYWTCKEAYAKARGVGMQIPFDQCEISFGHGAAVGAIKIGSDPGAAQWSVMKFVPSPGYSAAVAMEGTDWAVRCLPLVARDDDSRKGASHVFSVRP